MYMWDGGIFWAWLLNWVVMIVFWTGIIILIVWGINKLIKSGRPETRSNPLDIAKERYARGEISREEFEQIKKDLE
jgi:putative membrane protein